jgi:hypothetical protein
MSDFGFYRETKNNIPKFSRNGILDIEYGVCSVPTLEKLDSLDPRVGT